MSAGGHKMSTQSSVKNPYLGLSPFTLQNSELCFGREGRITEMIQKLNRKRFLAVVGASGSGKSSLVGAGLIPNLLKNNHNQQVIWRVATMRPCANPIQSLVESLVDAGVIDDKDDGQVQQAMLAATLRRSSMGLVHAIQQAQLTQKVLLIVDQFEELFRYSEQGQSNAEQTNQFVALLLEAVKQKNVPIFICITMRSDYFGDCAKIHGLPEIINEGQYLVPPMTRSERKKAITEPMKQVGCTITNRLVQRLLNELSVSSNDQLPTLQHALMCTFSHWQHNAVEDPAMDIAHYEAIGTITNGLNKHAESIYLSFDDKHKILTEQLFKHLTVRENNHDIRYPSSCAVIQQVCEIDLQVLTKIVERFRQQDTAFLMPPLTLDLSEQIILDISHESLMRVWQRLREWVNEEAQDGLSYRRILDRATLHQQGKAELLSGTELAIVLEWQQSISRNEAWAERYGGKLELALHYINCSVIAQQQQQAMEEQVKRAEAESIALREQSDVLKNIISSIPHRIFWKDHNSVYQGANEQFSRQAGLSPEQIVGKTDFDLPWSHEEAVHYIKCDREVMDCGEPMMNIEESQQTADGETYVLTDKVPLKDSAGNINGILGIFLDITKRKQTEKQLQQALSQSDQTEKYLLELNQVIKAHMNKVNNIMSKLDKDMNREAISSEIDELSYELDKINQVLQEYS